MKKPRIDCVCEYCGLSFPVSQYDVGRGKGRFCSKSCKMSVQNQTGHIEKVCPQCGRTFRIKPGRYFQKFCSLECSADASRTRIKKSCEICGAIYAVKPSEASTSRYCSYVCAGVGKQLSAASRNKPTKIEAAIHNALMEQGIAHESQFVIGRCILDFALPEYRLGIECDGDYWHNRPGEKQRDKARDRRLKKQGWTVLRFSESAIKASPQACADRVLGWLTEYAANNGQLHLF